MPYFFSMGLPNGLNEGYCFLLLIVPFSVLYFVMGKFFLPIVEIRKFRKITEISKKEFKIFDQIWSLVVIFILQNLMPMLGFELTTSKNSTVHSTTVLAQSEFYIIDISVLIRIEIWDYWNYLEIFGRNYVFPPLTQIHKFCKIRPKFRRIFPGSIPTRFFSPSQFKIVATFFWLSSLHLHWT
jgi:hypothetical protein